MYHGTNPIALQSQQWLSDSLVSLMEEKPFAQITILDICKRADLSRQTFYNFYENKEEILHFCLQQKYEAQFSKYSGKSSVSIDEIIESFSYVLTENKKLLTTMLKNNLDRIIADGISDCISLFANHFVSEEKNDELLPYSKVLLSGALAYLLVYWFRQDNPIPVNKLSKLLNDFFCGELYSLSSENKKRLPK